MQRSRLVLIPLFKGLQMVTVGTSLTETTYSLDVPELKNLLPQAEALILFYLTVGRTANFEWTVYLTPGFDREHEGTPVDLNGAFLASSGPGRTDYTTTSNFQPHTRVEARCRNASGFAGVNSAVTSAILGVKTLGM